MRDHISVLSGVKTINPFSNINVCLYNRGKWYHRLNAEHVELVAQSCHQLVELEVQNAALSPDFAIALTQNLPLLRRVKFLNCTLGDLMMFRLMEHYRDLESISCVVCNKTSLFYV